LKKLTPLFKPQRFTLEIYLTEKCSFACKYCQLHTPGVKFTDIDFDKLFAFDYSGEDVYIFGGEPMIHPQLDELLDRLSGNIVIQSNLSISTRRLRDILDKYNNVSISPSFHYEECDRTLFLENLKLINSYGKLGETAIMWLSEFDKEIFILYKILKDKYNNVWLEPTLPWTKDMQDWQDKVELKEYAKRYSADMSRDFGLRVNIDGVEKTLLQAYIDNDDLGVCGMTCKVGEHRICYDAHLNEWRGCTSDIIFRNNSEGVCKNPVCLLDLGYEKYHSSNINT